MCLSNHSQGLNIQVDRLSEMENVVKRRIEEIFRIVINEAFLDPAYKPTAR